MFYCLTSAAWWLEAEKLPAGAELKSELVCGSKQPLLLNY